MDEPRTINAMRQLLLDPKKRRRAWNVLVPTIIALLFIGNFISGWVRTARYAGQWEQFDSREHVIAETFPDGVRFEYPRNWRLTTFRTGGGRYGLRFQRILIDAPLQTLWWNIDWKRAPDWTLEDVLTWYINEVELSVDYDELHSSSDAFVPTVVGKYAYPALMHDYHIVDLGPLQWPRPRQLGRVVLLKVGDEAFAITMTTADAADGSLEMFTRFLDSLEIYR